MKKRENDWLEKLFNKLIHWLIKQINKWKRDEEKTIKDECIHEITHVLAKK